jgi:hypothetical protein
MSALYTREYDFNYITGELSRLIVNTSTTSIVDDQDCLNNIYFNSVTSIDFDTAQVFSELKMDTHLELRSVQSIDALTLRKLVQFPGSLVIGLTSLSKEQCEILINHTGALELPMLVKLNIEQATILSEYKGNVLEFGALSEFNCEIATALSNYEGEYLSIEITSINMLIAEALSSYQGNLFLDALESLNNDEAQYLSKRNIGFLSLGSLCQLSDQTAELFSKNRKKLRLSNKTIMSDFARERMKNLVIYFVRS